MSYLAKITTKGQTTIPSSIRKALQAKPGDLLEWEMLSNGQARVRRVQPLDKEYLKALEGSLSEWHSEADEDAYRDL
ncbi:MAG: type II toxin-antitoxin system PrlF family antitoxin [Thiomonas sp.]|uniref:AbrB/MazE/SpoVT family DNA-binding domain-containing protein n=1 Tax=Thiomonas sp. TaxID=2047785 RepID=UPI002A37207D|nr:type II toxin-antitoxin system PrlF family antitoxin [Thiomonas sp.]MDY0329819.1 type II toxin-antitoxin system PrlF family antitoxin [Thiomonas sp.]